VKRSEIPFDDFRPRAIELWGSHWMLLTVGDLARRDFNTMAVAWGSFGTMWEKPFAMVVVRPTRYTYAFLDRFDTFTLCAFAEKHREAVKLLGSKSGRDGDKIAESGLTPAAARVVASPVFEEAELAVECRKIYWQDLDPSHFLAPEIHELYEKRDYHRMFFGEVVAIAGTPAHRLTSRGK
jgi:flavin reductase (DIM6/NTAB) family NADH-FMN oxidoreductase RutF